MNQIDNLLMIYRVGSIWYLHINSQVRITQSLSLLQMWRVIIIKVKLIIMGVPGTKREWLLINQQKSYLKIYIKYLNIKVMNKNNNKRKIN